MVDTDVTITNTSDTKTFLFRGVGSFKTKDIQPPIKIPFVNENPANQFLFRFIGKSQQIQFTFTLFDDGNDVSSGTGGTIITILEQISFLRDTVFDSDFDTTWTLTQTRHFPFGINGVITSVDIDSKGGGPNLATGIVVFDVGRSGAIS